MIDSSALFVPVSQLYTTVKLAGAVYLGWLPFQVLQPGGVSAFKPVELKSDSARRLFTMGLVTNLLNLKAAIMYLSLISKFVHQDNGNPLLQGFTLGSVQIVVALTVNLLIVLAVGTIAVFLSNRSVWLNVQRYLMGTSWPSSSPPTTPAR